MGGSRTTAVESEHHSPAERLKSPWAVPEEARQPSKQRLCNDIVTRTVSSRPQLFSEWPMPLMAHRSSTFSLVKAVHFECSFYECQGLPWILAVSHRGKRSIPDQQNKLNSRTNWQTTIAHLFFFDFDFPWNWNICAVKRKKKRKKKWWRLVKAQHITIFVYSQRKKEYSSGIVIHSKDLKVNSFH